MLSCSLVVRSFNEERNIGRLLEGVQRQTITDVQVILVDSGSTDATMEIAAQRGAKVLHINPAEFTFGRSLNIGLEAASRPLVAIASAHVHPVFPDWLEQLLAPFIEPEVALSYGKQRGDARSRFSEQQIFSRWYPEESLPRQERPFCNNANAAIRRSVWEAHPFDETLTGLEDLAWAKEAQKDGYHLSYVAEAEVVHAHDETPQGVFNRYRREAMAYKQIYPEVHFNLYDTFRNVSSSIGFDILHAARQRCLVRNLASIFWFRTAQFWGTYQGYHHSSLLTPNLRQTFYYHTGWKKPKPVKREMEPIRYNE